MRKIKERTGVALVELLGALVIFGIVSVLVTSMISVFISAQQSIYLEGKMTAAGLLVTRSIENKILEFEPTNVSYCVGEENCIILEKQYVYSYVEGQTAITKQTLDPFLQVTIRYLDGALHVGDTIIEPSPYWISLDSQIVIEDRLHEQHITFYITIEDGSGKTAQFAASYSVLEDFNP